MVSVTERIKAFVDGTPVEETSEKKINERKTHHEKGFVERITAIVNRGESKSARKIYTVVAVIMALIIIGSLIYTVSFLPHFGNASNPANNEVVKAYVENGIHDTGAINFVAGMILDYRAFDTLGESTVLFIAASTVIILLLKNKTKDEKKEEQVEEDIYEDKHDLILRHGALILVPFTIIFGIYVILNGHLSPGGGFSGGTIMGASLILYNLAFGDKSTKKFFNFKIYKIITILALSFYALSKTYSFYTGANFIHSIIPNGIAGNVLSSGLILPLNICVGIVVACTMFGFYSLFDREEI